VGLLRLFALALVVFFETHSSFASELVLPEKETIQLHRNKAGYWQVELWRDHEMVKANAYNTLDEARSALLSRSKENPWPSQVEELLERSEAIASFCKTPDARTDYLNLWDHSVERDQGFISNCHIFGATGLIEAKIKQTTGKAIALSAKDLFLQHLQSKTDLDKMTEEMTRAYAYGLPFDYHGAEVGNISEDFGLVKDRGICTEKNRPYDFETSVSEVMAKQVLKIFGAGTPPLEKMRAFRETRAQTWLGIGAKCPDVRRAYLLNDVSGIQANLRVVRKMMVDSGMAELFADQASSECKEERGTVKKLVSNFEIKKIDPTPKAIFSALASGPVAVDVLGYASLAEGRLPNSEERSSVSHTPILAGFDCATEEFLIKNSWGESEPTHIRAELLFGSGALRWGFYIP
jgi:hypothetical protein